MARPAGASAEEKQYKSWSARYGLTTANRMLLARVDRYLKAMARLRSQQKRQHKISKRVGDRLAHQADTVRPQRRFMRRMMRRIRSLGRPRFRIFARGGKVGGLRGLWRRSLRRLKRLRPGPPRSAAARREAEHRRQSAAEEPGLPAAARPLIGMTGLLLNTDAVFAEIAACTLKDQPTARPPAALCGAASIPSR